MKAVPNKSVWRLFLMTLAPLLMLSVSSLPIADFEKGLLDGVVVGVQFLLVLSLYRAKTHKT